MKVRAALGVCVLVAIATAVVVSYGSATSLCKEEAGSGECQQPYGAGTELVGAASSAVLESAKWTVTCSKSTLTAKTLEDGTGEGKPLNLEVSGLGFEGCEKSGGGSCTVSAINLAYEGSLAWTAGNNGTLTLSKAGTPNPGATVKCGLTVNCTLSKETLALEALGGNPASFKANKASLTVSGEACPETATLTATYSLTLPEAAAFVAQKTEPPTLLCTVKESPCKKPYGLMTTIEGSLVNPPGATFEWGGKVQNTCAEGTWEGKSETAGAPLVGSLQKFSFAKCTCTTVADARLPYRVETYALTGPNLHNGSIGTVSGGKGKPFLEITCGGTTCKWSAPGIPAFFEGGDPAQIKIKGADFFDDGTKCGEVELKATYSLSKPKPVWVEH